MRTRAHTQTRSVAHCLSHLTHTFAVFKQTLALKNSASSCQADYDLSTKEFLGT